MLRRAAAGMLLACLALSLGCASCASPWDYCGPVYAGGDCQACIVDDRQGSAFTGGAGEMLDGGYYEGEYEGAIVEGEYEGQEAYERPLPESPYDEPTPADSGPVEPGPAEPTPAEPDALPPVESTQPEPTPLTPPDTATPPTESFDDDLPPLETPPSNRRAGYFTPAAEPQGKAPAEPQRVEEKSASGRASSVEKGAATGKSSADETAAAKREADSAPKQWQAAGKGRYRR